MVLWKEEIFHERGVDHCYEKMANWDAAKKQMDEYVKQYPEDSRIEKEAEFLETR